MEFRFKLSIGLLAFLICSAITYFFVLLPAWSAMPAAPLEGTEIQTEKVEMSTITLPQTSVTIRLVNLTVLHQDLEGTLMRYVWNAVNDDGTNVIIAHGIQGDRQLLFAGIGDELLQRLQVDALQIDAPQLLIIGGYRVSGEIIERFGMKLIRIESRPAVSQGR